MRGLWDQDQIMSADTIRSATLLLGALLAAVAAITVLASLGNLFTGRFGTFFVQLAGGLAIPLAVWLIVRLLSESVMAQHRLNDRLTVLTDAIRDQREAEPAPKPMKRAASKAAAKPKSDAPASASDDD